MSNHLTQAFNVRLSTEIVEAAQRRAKERHCTVSEVVREALITLLEKSPDTERHEELMYEVVKTRALLRWFMEREMDSSRVDQLLELAEGDAAEYMRKRGGDEDVSL
jgi:hypothetical protein